MIPSKRWPEFLEHVRRVKTDEFSEKIVRTMLMNVAEKCPIECLVELGKCLVEYVKRENKCIIEQN